MQIEQYPRVVVGVIIYNDDGKIFLTKSHKWQGQWVVPGGHLEWGETLEDCVKREILEETNLIVGDVTFLAVQESILSPEFHKPKHMIFLDYYCRFVSGEVVINDEMEEYVWVDPVEALQTLQLGSSTRVFIQKFIDVRMKMLKK